MLPIESMFLTTEIDIFIEEIIDETGTIPSLNFSRKNKIRSSVTISSETFRSLISDTVIYPKPI